MVTATWKHVSYYILYTLESSKIDTLGRNICTLAQKAANGQYR